ncbi:hypothetical protein KDA_15830 [Dictyobacter alpinus]|uniref:Glycosyl transferase family 9 n=1 Tax=Dictyobacter alpinus TaxID=2014873 RepID=A0A402B425_9CHLR|nr:glycosyltransferase family 9 protein [Dictyobacter alpinus]GCE26099.1 hypothetical protein KDA_15830 [Dictyobacter alpinus]
MREVDLSFLCELARNSDYPLVQHELESLQNNQQLLRRSTAIVILLGGKAGRLGECVVGTALLEGTLRLLRVLNKEGISVQIMIDQRSLDLFQEENYQQAYWPEISLQGMEAPLDPRSILSLLTSLHDNAHLLVLDFHGAHDGMPYYAHKQTDHGSIDILGNLFRVGVRNYSQRGPEHRYAAFLADLFALKELSMDSTTIQPHLRLTIEDEQQLKAYPLDPAAITIICFFQSVVLAKCYELWDEVMQLLCEHIAREQPGQKLEFVIACGPDEGLPDGFKKSDIADWLQDFTGVADNARVKIYSTATLRDLAVLTSHATLALSDDTGPGHIAGALGIPVIIPFLPGNVYAKDIWSSTLYHHGITIVPNPYSTQQIEAAVIWGHTDIIDSIPPAELYKTAIPHLQKNHTRQQPANQTLRISL